MFKNRLMENLRNINVQDRDTFAKDQNVNDGNGSKRETTRKQNCAIPLKLYMENFGKLPNLYVTICMLL